MGIKAIAVRLEVCLEFVAGTLKSETRTFKCPYDKILLCSKSTPKNKGFAFAVATVGENIDHGGEYEWIFDNLEFVYPFEVECKQSWWTVDGELEMFANEEITDEIKGAEWEKIIISVCDEVDAELAAQKETDKRFAAFFKKRGVNPETLAKSKPVEFSELLKKFADEEKAHKKPKRNAANDFQRIQDIYRLCAVDDVAVEKCKVAFEKIKK